ncbi:MAG: class I SAM-dependent methyltransferase [Vicinamibacterales bacterium]
MFFSYCRCTACGLLHCPLYFSAAQLAELYRQMPDNTAGVPVEALRKTQRGYFDILKRFSAPEGDYLEVGPDIGLFTEYCVQEGRFGRYHLFEPNRAVWPTLSDNLKGRRHDIYDQMFDFDAVPDQSVSVAVMIHVLDHVIDPVQTLRVLRRTLKEKAVLMLVTHDESSLLARLMGTRWPPYCLQHPELFRQASISALLKRAGFSVLRVDKTYNHFPLTYLMKHLCWMLGARLDIRGTAGPQLPIKLGNILTVATPL